MTKVCVTGGAGFIGSHLADALVARGDDVVLFDNLRRGSLDVVPREARFIEGDIRDVDALPAAFEGVEVVYHLAAQSNVMGAISGMDYSFETNVVGTFNVLKAASAAGVRRVVFASSREVYGDATVLPVLEQTPLVARNPYGASKVAGEAYCRAWSVVGSLEVSILRLANVYGPRDAGRVIPLWVTRGLRGEALQVYGGDQVLDFVSITTTVEALLRVADVPATEPVNVGTGKGTALRDLATRILALTGHRSAIEVLPARNAEVVRFVADITRMRGVLGIEPPADPLDGLERLVESFARA